MWCRRTFGWLVQWEERTRGAEAALSGAICVQLVELKNGETYNGHLVSCDNWMNINLREVICTSRVSLGSWGSGTPPWVRPSALHTEA